MTKNNRKRHNRTDLYWESAAYNRNLFMLYRTQIVKLAMSRYKWINLPPTIDERYLEMTLLYQGVATIAFPKRQRGTFYGTQVAMQSPPNIYDNPSKWYSIGNNGWRFTVTPKNGVIVWDNRPRYPLMQMVDMWAQELADIRRTKQINRLHVKTPFILSGPQEMNTQMVNMFKQISGGEPAIITNNGLSNISVDAIQTGVTFMGKELTEEELNTWQQVYAMLGIENLTYKAERMVQDEVNKRDEPTDIMALDGLNCRRLAAKQLNERFSNYLEAPIDCVWAKDNRTDNYNIMHNIREHYELLEGVEIEDE